MPAGDYIGGALVFLLMLGGVLGGAALLTRRRLPHLRGSTYALAFATLATLGLLAVHIGPALLGVMARGSVLAATALWLGAAALVPAGGSAVRTARADDPAPAAPERGIERLGAAVAVSVVLALTFAFLTAQATVPPVSIDALTFHLPGVARWVQTGSLWQIDNMLPNVAHGNFPNNGDVVLLAAILPWHNDFLSHLVMYPFYALTGVATYALARELGAGRAIATVAGCLVLAIPAVALPALALSLVDALMLFGFLTGVLFLVRHHRTDSRADLVLAGLALGISFGTKWYAVSSVAIVVAVWVVASLLAKRSLRTVVARAAAVTGLVILAGGVWLLRNWVESGNPFLPVRVAPLGVTLFEAPHDVLRENSGFTIASYFGDGSVWSEFILPQLRRALAAPAGLLGVGLLVTAGMLAWRAPRHCVLLAVASGTALIAVAYSVTPYSAGGPEGQPNLVGADARYVVPAVALAAAVSAAVLRGTPRLFAPALALIAIGDGVVWTSKLSSNYGQPSGGDWFVAAIAAGGLVACVGWAIVQRRRLALPGRRGAVGIAAVTLAVTVAVGYELQARFNDGRYLGADPVIDYVVQHAEADQRIGLAGEWDDTGLSPVLPSFGSRLENEVEYVGAPTQDMLRPYPTEAEFIAAVEEGDYDFLIVGPGQAPGSLGEEARWAGEAGFSQIASSRRLTLFGAPTVGVAS